MQFGFHALQRVEVFVRRIGTADVGNGGRVAKSGQRVDMRIGIVAGEVAMVQPQHPVDAEKRLQFFLKLGFI